MLIKNRRGKTLLPAISVLAAVGAMLLLWQIGFRSYGHIQVKAVDAYTLAPLCDVSVSVAEFDIRGITDSFGNAQLTGIPIIPLMQRGLPRRSYGECTIVAVGEGYRPSVLLHAHVYESRMRRATLYMFPVETDDTEIIAITESPDDCWLRQLTEKYGG